MSDMKKAKIDEVSPAQKFKRRLAAKVNPIQSDRLGLVENATDSFKRTNFMNAMHPGENFKHKPREMNGPKKPLPKSEEAMGEDNDLVDNQRAEVMAEQAGEPTDALQGNTFFIAVDGDAIGAKVGQAVLHDDIAALEEVSHAINAGQNLLIDFVEQRGGKVISAGGDELVAGFDQEVSADELEQIRQQYANIVGATLTVGTGSLPSEAGKALIFGKLNGKDQIAPFSPEVEARLYEAHANPQNEEESKQNEHYLDSLDENIEDEHSMGPNQDVENALDQDTQEQENQYDGADQGYFQEDESENPDDDSFVEADTQEQFESQDEPRSEDAQGDFNPDDYFEEDYSDDNQSDIQPHDDDLSNSPSGDESWEDPEGDMDSQSAVDAVEEAAMQENQGEEESADESLMDTMKDELSADPQSSLKDKLGSILESYVQEKEQLEILAQENPDLYQEVLMLLQQMIKVAKMMVVPSQDLQEEAPVEQDPQIAPQAPEDMGKPQP